MRPAFSLVVRAFFASGAFCAAGCGASTHDGTANDGARELQRDAGTPTDAGAAALGPSDPHDAGTNASTTPAASIPDASSAPSVEAGAEDASRVTMTPDAGAAVLEADGGFVCDGTGSRFATSSPAHSFGPGQNNGQDEFPAPIFGPPKGGGICQGSTDVVSLGNGGFVVVEFAGNAIVDGPGPDFIVFENPFGVGCDPANVFAELGTVAVSDDGVSWKEFPCTATAPPYGECSGYHVVNANADSNDVDPTDPAVAGGDAYDLAELGVKSARYVRVTDRADITGQAGVYDLDAVSIVHPACP